eukprot:CAMPEP_0179005808 /NCGR_PEP_ID=MMETSP0795-20121207/14174_1 /TAXON_ID=88552 /ORGANISM="Amoebophrya sp., Strain Ameob2" /LENGTH=159 /DNA_ID=CAMNT_0020700439 /DNA_START=380 /DNA_END=857 /DNA_ORIENTATION=+
MMHVPGWFPALHESHSTQTKELQIPSRHRVYQKGSTADLNTAVFNGSVSGISPRAISVFVSFDLVRVRDRRMFMFAGGCFSAKFSKEESSPSSEQSSGAAAASAGLSLFIRDNGEAGALVGDLTNPCSSSLSATRPLFGMKTTHRKFAGTFTALVNTFT